MKIQQTTAMSNNTKEEPLIMCTRKRKEEKKERKRRAQHTQSTLLPCTLVSPHIPRFFVGSKILNILEHKLKTKA